MYLPAHTFVSALFIITCNMAAFVLLSVHQCELHQSSFTPSTSSLASSPSSVSSPASASSPSSPVFQLWYYGWLAASLLLLLFIHTAYRRVLSAAELALTRLVLLTTFGCLNFLIALFIHTKLVMPSHAPASTFHSSHSLLRRRLGDMGNVATLVCYTAAALLSLGLLHFSPLALLGLAPTLLLLNQDTWLVTQSGSSSVTGEGWQRYVLALWLVMLTLWGASALRVAGGPTLAAFFSIPLTPLRWSTLQYICDLGSTLALAAFFFMASIWQVQQVGVRAVSDMTILCMLPVICLSFLVSALSSTKYLAVLELAFCIYFLVMSQFRYQKSIRAL
eukprot:TRINITY_DN13129_c0_g1_i8.p1 TRINITY_DN13129_c0_g1~~TRINITY_DN13129_c0_g1_i8.p1  ORF type:complete len:334 (+),score=59.42 TRINITY_DN13129_c0_g1_i8:86-1087(+)